jgi:hypothetical protein
MTAGHPHVAQAVMTNSVFVHDIQAPAPLEEFWG